jgi:hypothetical protein
LANILFFLFGFLLVLGRFETISIALADSGNILLLDPFSAFILTFRCSQSIESQSRSAISPHLAPVSFSNWQKHACFFPRAAISRSISFSVGMYGFRVRQSILGLAILFGYNQTKCPGIPMMVFFVLSLSVDLASAALMLSGSNRSAPSCSSRLKDFR